MKTTKFISIVLIFLTAFATKTEAQESNLTYYKIEISGEKNQIMKMMNNTYKKEFFSNNEICYYVNQLEGQVEIIQYDSNKIPTKFYIHRNDSLFVNETFKYTDLNLGELTVEERTQLMDYYQVNRDVTKKIYDIECFQVLMKDPNGGDSDVEMFVTETLPNMPNHFPLSSQILNAEPLEINLNLMGSEIKIEIVKRELNMDIEEALGLNFNNAFHISDEELIEMKIE